MANNFQSRVYECSAKNASVKISNNHWINEFKGGIELDVNDTIKVLGSFIQEKGDGENIEIDDDISIMLRHNPYVTSETIKLHVPQGTGAAVIDYQYSMKHMALPVSATDNFGVEPPYSPGYIPVSQAIGPDGAHPPFKMADFEKIRGSYTFGSAFFGSTDGSGEGYGYNGLGDKVKTLGWTNDISSQYQGLPPVGPTNGTEFVKDVVGNMTGGFYHESIPREFYISSLCKLIRVPLVDGIRCEALNNGTSVRNTVTKLFTHDPTRNIKAPFQPGDFIGTYFISGYTQWNQTPNKPAILEGTSETNVFSPRYAPGPRSVVAQVLGCRNFTETHTMYDTAMPPATETQTAGVKTLEYQYIYVWNYVNPATIKSHNNNLTLGGVEITPRHGSTEYRNGYSNYANNNSLNGGNNDCPFQQYYLDGAGVANNIEFSQDLNANQGRVRYISPLAAPSGDLIEWSSNQFKSKYMPNATTAQTLPGNNQTSKLSFLWASVGSQWGLNGEVEGDSQAVSTWFGQSTVNASGALRNLMYIQPFDNYIYQLNQNRAQQVVEFSELVNVGGLTRINMKDDNTRFDYLANDNELPFCIFPMARQTLESPYKTAYQKNLVKNETLWAIKCPSKDAGDYSATNLKEPWASGMDVPPVSTLIPWNRGVAYTADIRDGLGVVTATTSAPRGSWNLSNCGSDQVCSIHPQTIGGDAKFKYVADGVSHVWNSDIQLVKNYKSELKIPKGFYSVAEIVELINNQLHLDNVAYKRDVGNFTTVGLAERQLAPNPSVVPGNFIHSYLPEVTYGFTPVTDSMAASNPALASISNCNKIDNLTSTFLNLAGDLITQDDLAGYDDITAFTFPFNYNADGTAERTSGGNCMFKLIGGKTYMVGSASDVGQPDYSQLCSCVGYEPKVDIQTPIPWTGGNTVTSGALNYYPTRTFFNSFTYGGSAKIWIGSPNPTFSYDENQSKFYFEFLYNPIRPVQKEDTTGSEISSGDAEPSIVVNTDGNGEISAEYGGIYITNLAADEITTTNTHSNIIDRPDATYYQDSIDNDAYILTASTFWEGLGFQTTQFNEMAEIYTDVGGALRREPWDPYIFISRALINGKVLRNYPVVDISVNGSNPFKTRCTPVAPVNEYFVTVNSDEFLADNTPRLSSNPFYLIGSSLPVSHYHGTHGTKLPVIGICGRNYARFSFVFDLSESSIVYRVQEKAFLTSIETHIYLNDYKDAGNLQPNSSVIYVIEKGNYGTQADPDVIKEVVQQQIKQIQIDNTVPNPKFYYDEDDSEDE